MGISSDLLELQEVDLSILRDKRALESIPEAGQIQQVRAKLKELGRRTTKVVGLLKDKQIEHEDNIGRRATLTRHVEEINLENAQSSDFRRIRDNNAELDRLAKRLEKIDFNQRGVEAEIERLQGLLEQSKSIRTSLESKEHELLLRFRDVARSLKEDLERLEMRRDALTEGLPEDVLSAYDQSCVNHNHVGVSRLSSNGCSGCGVELQPSQMDVLRRGPAVATCPTCGRMLIVRTEE